MIYECSVGNCGQYHREFQSWDELVDHMLRDHRLVLEDNKLLRYNFAWQRGLRGTL